MDLMNSYYTSDNSDGIIYFFAPQHKINMPPIYIPGESK